MEVRVLPAPQIRSVLQQVDGSDLESDFCGFEVRILPSLQIFILY